MFFGVGHVGRSSIKAKVSASLSQIGPSLYLDFMTPGQLNPRITFTRASTATYTDASGTIQTAATNAPRWDYDPVTHALRGLLIEEARTNTQQGSGNLGAAPWAPAATGVAAPVVTANNATAPDGTLSAARIVMPAVPAGANASFISANAQNGAVQTVFSVWLRGAAGGEIVNLVATNFASYSHTTVTLSTAWQRFSFVTTPAATAMDFVIGADMRDATQTATPAQTFYAWGAQVEAGAFVTSYIPTTVASVTRAIDQCNIPPGNMTPWFSGTVGSWLAEFLYFNPSPNNSRIVTTAGTPGSWSQIFLTSPVVTGAQYDGVAPLISATAIASGANVKVASTWIAGQAKVCSGGGPIAISAALTNGYIVGASNGIFFMTPVSAGSSDNTSGYLRRVQYWPRVLSDAEMQTVTT